MAEASGYNNNFFPFIIFLILILLVLGSCFY